MTEIEAILEIDYADDPQEYEKAIGVALRALKTVDGIRGYIEMLRTSDKTNKAQTLDFIEKYINITMAGA